MVLHTRVARTLCAIALLSVAAIGAPCQAASYRDEQDSGGRVEKDQPDIAHYYGCLTPATDSERQHLVKMLDGGSAALTPWLERCQLRMLKAREQTFRVIKTALVAPDGPPKASKSTNRQPPVAAPLVRAKVIYAPDINDYYPYASRRDNEQGRGIARICVDTSGRVEDAQVYSSTGSPTLDAAMLQFAKAFRFQPATRAGQPVNMCSLLPVKFVQN